jgi:hypothetical protein
MEAAGIILPTLKWACSRLRDAWHTVGTGLGCIFLFLLLMFFGILGYGIFLFIDTSSSREYVSVGYVSDKNHWQSIRYSPSGRVMIPTGKYDHYDLKLLVDGKSIEYSTDKKNFEKAKINDRVKINYIHGEISDRVYVKKFQLLE